MSPERLLLPGRTTNILVRLQEPPIEEIVALCATAFDNPEFHLDAETVEAMLAPQESIFIGAFRERTLQGYLIAESLAEYLDTPRMAEIGASSLLPSHYISCFAVDPRLRRTGVGKRLLYNGVFEAHRQGSSHILGHFRDGAPAAAARRHLPLIMNDLPCENYNGYGETLYLIVSQV